MVIIVKSFNKSLINDFCSNLVGQAKGFDIVLKGMVSMPKKTKSFYGIKVTSCA